MNNKRRGSFCVGSRAYPNHLADRGVVWHAVWSDASDLSQGQYFSSPFIVTGKIHSNALALRSEPRGRPSRPKAAQLSHLFEYLVVKRVS